MHLRSGPTGVHKRALPSPDVALGLAFNGRDPESRILLRRFRIRGRLADEGREKYIHTYIHTYIHIYCGKRWMHICIRNGDWNGFGS